MMDNNYYEVELDCDGSSETFEYETLAEAVLGMTRLVRSANEHRSDGHDRRISIYIGGDEV